MRSFSELEVPVSSRNLGLSFMASICAAADVAVLSYYSLAKTIGRVLGAGPATDRYDCRHRCRTPVSLSLEQLAVLFH
jgi:hypothetical protein